MTSGDAGRGSVSLWGCTVRGPLHASEHRPNQDAWIARRYAWGGLIAVADGLGSKPLSDLGARAACRACAHAANLCCRGGAIPGEQMARVLLERWLYLLREHKASDCATTCLFAFLQREHLFLGRLGDGMIAALSPDGSDDVLLVDEKEGSFANFTRSLHAGTKPGEWEFRTLPANRYESVLLCTDGVADDLRDEMRLGFARALTHTYADVPRNEARRELRYHLKHWPRPGHTDDKTIALMYLSPSSPTPSACEH